MPTKRFSRRTILRGALAGGAGIAVPLPIFDIMLNDNGDRLPGKKCPCPRRYCTWFLSERDHPFPVRTVRPPEWGSNVNAVPSNWRPLQAGQTVG